jgi:hypothetical protein
VIVATVAARAGVAAGWLLVGAKPTATELTFEQLLSEVEELVHRVAPATVSGP